MPFTLIKIAHVGITLLGGLVVLRLLAIKADESGCQKRKASHLLAVVAWLFFEIFCASVSRGTLGLSGFGMIHLIYLDVFLTLPLLGFWLWWRHCFGREKLRMTGTAAVLAWLSLCTPAVAYYGTWIEPFDLRLEERVVELRKGRGSTAATPFRVAVIADLQARKVTAHEVTAIEMAMKSEPDLILIAGDIIHWGNIAAYTSAIPEFRELLSKLHAPGGVFFVQGNTDIPQLEPLLFAGTDIVALRDRAVRLEINGNRVTLGGLALGHHRSSSGQDLILELETAEDNGDIRIVLSHLPDTVLSLRENSRIVLVVAGHTHGGQVQIPFFGPPLTLSDVPRSIGAGGLSNFRGNQIYVSRGIGVERAQAPRVRFLAPPEVSVLTLQPSGPSGLGS